MGLVKLTQAQRSALEWLPENGSWRRDVHNVQSSALEYLERRYMAVEFSTWHGPKAPMDDGLHGWIWRITPEGERVRKGLTP